MTSLRGPDPYALAEERLAPLLARRHAPCEGICSALHETVPTYDWVGLLRRTPAGMQFAARCGAPRHTPALSGDCAVLLADAATVIIHDVASSPTYQDCFPAARALIAVPIGREMTLVVASEHQGAFGLADRDLLELVARYVRAMQHGQSAGG